MKIPVYFLALLCLSITIGTQANLATSHARLAAHDLLHVSMPDSPASAEPAAPAVQAQRGSPPWWQGFRDGTLDALIVAAQRHAASTDGADRATADVRIMGDTLQLPLDMQVAAAYVTVAARSHAARRDGTLALLASLCGMQPPELMALVGPALRTVTLPRFVAPVPHVLPASLLMQREDVALASSLYHRDAAAGALRPRCALAGHGRAPLV